ncbi:META domain-containing protein [Miltoncostaea oceani]|uniref:META domain-containing protein n=1 Tax=Miltoncostaea oceani TaxID=2843216 RepID=UPI001C3D63A3|nr:META domain-containing protein [Miltoncostaea oceani]
MTGGDPLAGAWVVVAVGGTPVPEGGEPPSLVFDGAGRVSGSGGVNRLAGPYAVDGDVLTAGPLMTTRMAGPPGWNDLEVRLLAALERPLRITAGGDRLTLGDVDLVRAPAA